MMIGLTPPVLRKGQPCRAGLLQVIAENGTLRARLPVANKAHFGGRSEDVVGKVVLIWFGDPDRAVVKAGEV